MDDCTLLGFFLIVLTFIEAFVVLLSNCRMSAFLEVNLFTFARIKEGKVVWCPTHCMEIKGNAKSSGLLRALILISTS